jgi:hypothetical protein
MPHLLAKYKLFYNALYYLQNSTLLKGMYDMEDANQYRHSFIHDKIYDKKAEAIEEIETLIYRQNNNADRLVNSIHIDCKKLAAAFEQIRLFVPLADEWYKADLAVRRQMLTQMDKNQRWLLGGFNNIYHCFDGFYQTFKEKSGIINAADYVATFSERQEVKVNDTMDIIEDYLHQFSTTIFRKGDYDKIKACFLKFFNSRASDVKTRFTVIGRSKTALASECGKMCQEIQGQVSYEFLDFLRNCFIVFADEKIDPQHINRSNLYKYCTS